MAQTYWDPANLLQITDDDSPGGDIQCVGRARSAFGARCRWTVDEPKRATARVLLTQLAARRPSAVTAEELPRLAQCCLCQHHVRQGADAASRWTRVVRRAAEQHDRLVAAARSEGEQRLPTPEAEDVVAVKLELERELAAARARSAERVRALEADLRDARDKLLSVEKGYVQLRALLGMTQRENGDLSLRVAEAERQRDALGEQLERAVDAGNRDAESTQQSITGLETRVRDLEGERASLRERLVAADGNAVARQEEVDRLSKAVGGLEHDKASLQQELKAASDELEDRQTEADRLSKAVTDLQHDKSSLQEQLKAALIKSDDQQSAVDRLSEEVDSLRAENGKLRIDCDAKLDAQQAALDKHSNETDSLRLENGKLRADRDAALDSLKSTSLERDAARDEASRLAAGLEQSRTELEVGRSRNAELRERAAALGRRVSTLEAGVATCSLHGLGVWFGRQSRKLGRRSPARTAGDGGVAVPV
ncbi:hypothetical protein DL766_000116 [Monosporascus sp. MC13-8B]|uniref:Uncharacterized protein n=1 Tax=Monosporascus cannonballus TaxID=155416 RepID=A0ABY0H8I3_9PEZI|nr:hypothetical protein DL762_005261 [Monosporascus cannonballus]RYO97487.1 hypothetical protein DL763_002755 [Monosporascus cannonballus]RYP40092.1 hypothetical protein DL766_000116 [Monosporascus sp. MC13-8B]